MRILRVVATLGVAAGLLATPSTGVVGKGSSTDPGLRTSALSTGPLANFEAKGGNLVRLLAGASIPPRAPCPAAPASVSVTARHFRRPRLSTGSSRRGTSATRTSSPPWPRPAGGSPARSPTARTWCARPLRSATQSPVARRSAGPGTTNPRGESPSRQERSRASRALGHAALPGARLRRRPCTQRRRCCAQADERRQGAPGCRRRHRRRGDEGQLPAIAALPAVEWIGQPPRLVKHNFNARWVNDTGVRDLYAATAPGRLNGAGQTAAVADTGVNYKYDLNGRAHVNFRDCDGAGVCKEAIYTQVTPGVTPATRIDDIQNNGTGHRKMVAYFDLGAAGPNMYDESSHGTHTAGSVTGDKAPYGSWQGADGIAPAARLVHQNTAATSGGLGGIPADEYDMLRQAYRPRNPAGVAESSPANGNVADYGNYVATEDARTTTTPGVLIYPVADDGTAMRYDRFIWDHEDMVVVASAGNEGPGMFQISSPAVAKTTSRAARRPTAVSRWFPSIRWRSSRHTARPVTDGSAQTSRHPARSSCRPRAARSTTSTPRRGRPCPLRC